MDGKSPDVVQQDQMISDDPGPSLLSRQIDEQREAFRSRTMDLSRHHVQPARITHLAPELLTWIFSFFQHPSIHQNQIRAEDINAKFADGHYETLKSLRLVCALFNQVATVFLLPILHVQLDMSSLDRIQAISTNPLLGAGLRGIQIRMGYRFKINALNKAEFISHQRRYVDQLLNYHAFFLGRRLQGDGHSKTSEACIWKPERFLMLERIRACVVACDRCLGRDDTGTVPSISSVPHFTLEAMLTDPVEEALIDEYQKVVHQAYEDYKAEYERDWPVVSEGLLVNALSQLLSGSSHRPITLSFQEVPQWKRYWYAFTDKKEATKWLARPMGSSEIWKLEGKPIKDELRVYSRLLWDLPIAISQTGSILKSLQLHDLLVGYKYNMIYPEVISPATPDQPRWDQLQIACRNLQTFILAKVHLHYKMDHDRYPIDTHIHYQPMNAGISIGKYIGALLSGKALERVELNASLPGLRALSNEGARCPLGYVLSQMIGANLKVVSLTNIGTSQGNLEAFFQSLSSKMELLSLSDVQLTHGSWVPVLDLLRDLMKERWTHRECQVQLDMLGGGEIVQLEATNQEEDEMTYLPRLMQRFEKYIQGREVDNNPAILPGVFS